MIAFGRDICGDLSAASRREWLVTNGIGGYAAGTLAALPTRSYHGLLIAALNPPLGRTLLLAALHETVAYDGHLYPLFAVRWQDRRVEPRGFDCLERFSLEGTTPLWSQACARRLLTSHGLRSLSPEDPAYVGRYSGDRRQRDGAYHQGTVWAWLIGPFVGAYLRLYDDRQTARSFLRLLLDHLADHGLGSISEIFDGDPPFTPRGCFAQAWSVAELLRVMTALPVTSPDMTIPPGP